MMTSQADQDEAPSSFDPHWNSYLVPTYPESEHSESQEWAHFTGNLQPKHITMSGAGQHYPENSYAEAEQSIYPGPIPNQFPPADLSFDSSRWGAASPDGESHGSNALSPRSERDYLTPGSLAGVPLVRSHSCVSAHSSLASEFRPSGGHIQTLQSPPTCSMAYIHQETLEETQMFPLPDEEGFMDHDQEDSITVMLPKHAQAPRAYPSTPNHQAPRPPSVDAQAMDIDASFDQDDVAGLEDNDDTNIDPSYKPNGANRRRNSRSKGGRHPTNKNILSPRPSGVTKRQPPSPRMRATPPSSSTKSSCSTFPCTFAFAGCTSVFNTKNEWKRHVASKHTCFFYWECHVGPCGSSDDRCFNRKDLFAQHLRRMHLPQGLSNFTKVKKDEWEKKLAALQNEGRLKGRRLIEAVSCPVPGCSSKWNGTKAWDDRMEHVAHHYEAVSRGQEKGGWSEQGGGVLEWALKEKAVEESHGEWRCVDGTPGDVDADGESE